MVDERESRQGRQAVLAALREAPGPLSVAEVADQVGLHANTVRGHLELMVHLGVVTRQSEHSGGRGRPRIIYELAPDQPPHEDAYKTLAEALANELSIISANDQRTADEAGLLWAQALVTQGRLKPATSREDAVAQVSRLFSELGFEASTEPLGDRLYLQACPYASIRDAFPGVCDIHLGLIRGSLAAMGSDLAVDRFDVDAQPGLCVAHLHHAPSPESKETS